MQTRIPPQEAATMLATAIDAGLAGPEDTSLIIYDLDRLRARVDEARQAFPPDTLHAVAVKANPLAAVQRMLADMGPGVGAEAASLPELHLALESGFPPERIVFDSPAKTVAEIRFALERGVMLNADNFHELDRIAEAVAELGPPKAPVGIRVNPQCGEGSIACTSVAAEYSKFGVPLSAYRSRLVEAFARHPWLTALHCHIGSQGCPMDMLVGGARVILDLAADIESAGGTVNVVDLGGGMPATYIGSDPKPSIADYAAALREDCPGLFNTNRRLATEFGRAIHASAGFAASRVEYVKEQPGHRTAVIHLGADMFLRPCYQPDNWAHEFLVLTPNGQLKYSPPEPIHIAGPLCFQGDFLARDIHLPRVSQNDWIIIRDAGAYTLSMWSRYNSRQTPAVLGLHNNTPTTLKPRESPTDTLRFWK